MADKVLRFTAEDSGYGQTIDRMAGKLRTAFSNTGMADILQEADAKFTNFSDKIKYIKTQLNEVKNQNELERKGEVGEAVIENHRTGYKRSDDAVQKEVSRAYEKEERSINRLVESLDKLGEKVEDADDHRSEQHVEEKQVLIAGRAGGGAREEGGSGLGLLGTSLATAIGFGLEQIASRILGAASNSISTGFDIARNELAINRQFQYNSNDTNGEIVRNGATKGITRRDELSSLGMSKTDLIKLVSATAASRRSGDNISNEVFNRLELAGSYGISQESISGLDRFYRRQNGGGIMDRSGLDATSTISEILSRADRQGILGVSKNDFTMLPEKIGQVTSLMAQQYSRSERTDANAAINLMLAGQRIGGRFADDRSADTFGKLGEAISSPKGPGSRAFILEALRRANPGMSPLELEAQMQNGLSADNVKTIFPAIQHVRSREMRGRIFQQAFGLDAQSALRMADSGNLSSLMQQMGQQPGTPAELEAQRNAVRGRAVEHTTASDQLTSQFSNSVTSFGESVARFVNGIFRDPHPETTTEPKNNKVVSASPTGTK